MTRQDHRNFHSISRARPAPAASVGFRRLQFAVMYIRHTEMTFLYHFFDLPRITISLNN
jgi:hypothetical protein